MPRQRQRKSRFRAGGRTRRFHSCRISKRIRHHPECGWNQTQTDRGATVTGAGDAGDYADERELRSSVAGRNVGATESADPDFHPSNVEARRFQSPVNSEWFMRGPVGRGQKGGDRLATSSRRQSETEADCLTRNHRQRHPSRRLAQPIPATRHPATTARGIPTATPGGPDPSAQRAIKRRAPSPTPSVMPRANPNPPKRGPR